MRRAAVVLTALLLSSSAARAEPASYVLFRLDPLGIEPEIVAQLEGILRVELQRVVGALPTAAEVDKVVHSSAKLQACSGDALCLIPLAKALKKNRIIAGNVGGLADSYVVNLKLVDGDGRELRRVKATLRGSPEELIAEVRVATYRLVAPEKLVGAVAVLSDVAGATVTVDGKLAGRTPLMTPLGNLQVGVHKLAVSRPGFSNFDEDIPIRFEKTTQVVVHQSAVSDEARRAELRRQGRDPVYSRWYFWVGVAAVAIGGGIAAGFLLPKQHAVDCRAMGSCP